MTVAIAPQLLPIGIIKWLTATFSAVSNPLPTRLLFFERRLFSDKPTKTCKPKGVKFASGNRCLNRTPRFLIVFAIAESTVVHQVKNINECSLDSTT